MIDKDSGGSGDGRRMFLVVVSSVRSCGLWVCRFEVVGLRSMLRSKCLGEWVVAGFEVVGWLGSSICRFRAVGSVGSSDSMFEVVWWWLVKVMVGWWLKLIWVQVINWLMYQH